MNTGRTDIDATPLQARCPDCHAEIGQAHLEGCDVARCLATGLQRLGHAESCRCPQDVWTGRWPGDRDRRRAPPVAPPVERERQPHRQRTAALTAVGDRSRRCRPGRLHLQRARFRVRLRRRHPRPDLLWRGDRWVTDPTATRDNALTRASAADVDLCVRRTYRVLLTRARAGTMLYSTDPETLALLHDIVVDT